MCLCIITETLTELYSVSGLSEPTTFGTFSGKDVPSQIASNGHIMRLEFQSDHSNTGKGFNISYTSKFSFSLPCEGSLFISRGFFWWNKLMQWIKVRSSLTTPSLELLLSRHLPFIIDNDRTR